MVKLFLSISLTFLVGANVVTVEGAHILSAPRKAKHATGGGRDEDHYLPDQVQKRLVAPFLIGLSLVCSGPVSSHAQDWNFWNGSVTLSDPLIVSFSDRQTGAARSLTFSNPQLIGAGGGGAVFSFDASEVLLKVSWQGTATTVQRECATLQLLEDAGVHASERCLASLAYDKTPRNMILVTPYMKDAVASVGEVETDAARRVAVDHISRTLVQMLSANIITIDVQPLISKATGQTIFIDMTEAQVLSSSSTYSFLDQTLISSFISEMVALIPESYWKIARTSTMDELTQLSSKEGRNDVAGRIQGLLEEQTPFLTD